MKTALSSLTGVLYNYTNQEVAELYSIDLGSYGVKYLTTANRPIQSGSTLFAPGGEYVSASSVSTQYAPTLVASGAVGAGPVTTFDVSSVNATAGQTLIAWSAVTLPPQNITTAVISFVSNGGSNTWSTLYSVTGTQGVTNTKGARVDFFVCNVVADITNATVRLTTGGNRYGVFTVARFSNVDAVVTGSSVKVTGDGGTTGYPTASLNSTRISSTVLYGFDAGAATVTTEYAGSKNYITHLSELAVGQYTGSVTTVGQSIKVGNMLSAGSYYVTMGAIEVLGALVTGSTTYTVYNNPAVQRGGSRTPVGTEVASMDLTLYPGPNTLGGLSMSLAAAQGVFDNAHVKVQRAYTNSSSTIYTTLFEGDVVDVKPGSTQVGLIVKSGMARLDLPFPPRVIQAQCSWQLYDTNCGVASASFTMNGTTDGGSTTTLVSKNASDMTVNAYRGGLLTITSGPLAGATRTVNSNTTGDLVVYPALASVPGSGVTFTVKKGCDKTRATCKTVFNNTAKFGGFADVPAPEK